MPFKQAAAKRDFLGDSLRNINPGSPKGNKQHSPGQKRKVTVVDSPEKLKKDAELARLRKGKHIRPLIDLPAFPFDQVQMKIRNRKLLASLNQKKRFKDFEYKNYDSTDSDVYDDEDYLKIT